MKKSYFAICLILASCIAFSSCSESTGLSLGFDGPWIGELPAVHFGIKSDKTEFAIDNVTMDFSYGDGSVSDVGGYIGKYSESKGEYEDCPMVCIGVYFYNSRYIESLRDARFEDYKSIEGLYFVKEIDIDDYNKNYDVTNNIFGSKYEHTETLTIPQVVFELTTGYVCIGVYEIAYIPSEDMYFFAIGDFQALKYQMLENDTVRISEPVGSYYGYPE